MFISDDNKLIYMYVPVIVFNFFLLKRWYHVWCLVIQDLSSKFIYCIYTCLSYITQQRTYIRSSNCVYKYIKLTYILDNMCFILLLLSSIFAENFISLQLVSYPFVFIFCDNKIYTHSHGNTTISVADNKGRP